MDFFKQVEPDMIEKVIAIFEEAQLKIKSNEAMRKIHADTKRYRAEQDKKKLATVHEETSSVSSSANTTPIQNKLAQPYTKPATNQQEEALNEPMKDEQNSSSDSTLSNSAT